MKLWSKFIFIAAAAEEKKKHTKSYAINPSELCCLCTSHTHKSGILIANIYCTAAVI